MASPKKRITEFVQYAEFDYRQVNLHRGKKYCYWFIQPATKPVKLLIGEVPDELKGKDLGKLIEFSSEVKQ